MLVAALNHGKRRSVLGEQVATTEVGHVDQVSEHDEKHRNEWVLERVQCVGHYAVKLRWTLAPDARRFGYASERSSGAPNKALPYAATEDGLASDSTF